MADGVYFDANTLVYWALGRAGSTKSEEQRCSTAFDALVDGPDSLAFSPLTLAEFTSVLWSLVRSGKPQLSYFDEAQAGIALEHLMRLIASSRIRVHNLHPRAFEVGMAVVGAGTREHGQAFRAWDAIHLFEACQWARTIDRSVVLATTDSDFRRIIATFSEFGRYVTLRDMTA